MNSYLSWFQRLTWVGVLVNLGFIGPALFAPDLLEMLLGPGSTELSLVWVANAGCLLLLASLFYLPAAYDPLGLPTYAWLAVVGRGSAALFWLTQNARWDLPGPVQTFWITDGAFSLVFLLLLQLGMPDSHTLTFANLARAGANVGEAITTLLRRDVNRNRYQQAFGLVTWLAVLGNLGFALFALLAPQALLPLVGGATVPFTYLWLGNCGLLLAQISLYALPAAAYPIHYRRLAWLTVGGWVISALFWYWQSRRWHLPQPTASFWVADALLAVGLALLLWRGLLAAAPVRRPSAEQQVHNLVDQARSLLHRPVAGAALALLIGGGGLLGTGLYVNLLKAEPDVRFADPEEQFKYGAIGLAASARIPYYLWQVLPELCSDKLPDPVQGWASLGLIFEADHELPVGFAKRQIGYPSVEPNCALCHTGTYRTEPAAPPAMILGGPAHTLDLQAFQWFLYDCAQSPQFTPQTILAAIQKHQPLTWFQRLLYRWVIIPSAKAGLASQEQGYAWQKSRPLQGRGRTDTFNPTKITVFHGADDGSIGTVDLPAIWNQRARQGMWLHWDGNNNAITERNFAAAMAIGATPDSVLPENFQIVTNYVLNLPPPSFPFPIDMAQAQRGWVLFERECAACHAFGGAAVGTVTDISAIGTDAHRLQSFTAELVADFHSVQEGLFHFEAYRKTTGYSNLPIDGAWARAPYLHNGAVPTLWDLLQRPEDRPKTFYKGYTVYDPNQLGFTHQGAEAAKAGFLLDTALPGNGNQGHLYGTTLTATEKWDLIEFLKTL